MTVRRILGWGIVASVVLTGLIWLGGSIPAAVAKLPDQGPSWYYWKLSEPTFWSRATAWGFYLAHQMTIWGMIWWAQRNHLKYTKGLHRINIFALAANALFIGLHFVQTYIWYDGLAQDVSIFSSQGSVIILLVWVLLMENQRRGLFFGKRVPVAKGIMRAAREYHGYVFSWAAIYTFWYHPMEASTGHLIGFFYMFLLLLQSSLFFTRAHLNRWWTFALEFTVLVHGTLVAWMQAGSTGFWPMFFWGFWGIFIITQMHGLGLSRATRWVIGGLTFAAILLNYQWRGWNNLNEIIRIPVIEYLSVLVLAGILWLVAWIAGRGRAAQRSPGALGGES